MPRLVAGLLLALLLALGVPRPAMAGDPEIGPFVDAAADVTTECDEYEPDHWLCSAQDDARSVFTSVTDFGTSFQVQSGRNRFDAATPVPAEDDYYDHLSELVRLAASDDAEAQEWLVRMNAGPEASGQLVQGAWTLTWSAGMLDLSDPPVATLSLDLFYFPAAAPSPPAPAAGPELRAYLDSYGLACADAADGDHCRLELADEEGLDAMYEVTTTLEAGEVIGVDAAVRSLDASMPSDAVSFLRGVAERSPVEDVAALLAWFDSAVASPTSVPYEAGGWSATWTDVAVDGGRDMVLGVRRVPAGEPAASIHPSAAPAAPAAPSPSAPVRRPFAESVPTLSEVSTEPIALLQSGLLAALVVFLMPFPGQLFNSTLEAHEDEVKRWFRIDRLGSAARGLGAFWASWPGVVTFTLVTAAMYGLLDPGFGFDLASLATYLGMLLGIVLVTAAFAIPAVLAHRHIGDAPVVKAVPVSLLVGVACVLVSRLTGFQPGYLYGLLIGLVFARELSLADEGLTTAIGATLMLIVAFAAWLGLGILPDGDGFGLVVARTTLAALMVAGLEGVVFGLLPMRFLPGQPLYEWSRVLWGLLLGIGAFAFFHILVNPASGYLSDTSRTPLLTVLGLLIGFSLVSVAFWAWFRFRPEPSEAGSAG